MSRPENEFVSISLAISILKCHPEEMWFYIVDGHLPIYTLSPYALLWDKRINDHKKPFVCKCELPIKWAYGTDALVCETLSFYDTVGEVVWDVTAPQESVWKFQINEIMLKTAEVRNFTADIREVEKEKQKLYQHKNEDPESLSLEPTPEQKMTDNFFKRSGDFWTICFAGKKSKPIKHVDGLLYMAYLLGRPGTSISCKDLYQSVSGITPDEVMDKGTAINEGLNIGSSTQAVNDDKAKQDYMKKYCELQNSLISSESELERQEIEKEMDNLLPHLKEKTFAKTDDKKAQANIKRRIDTAYNVILKANMKLLEDHLRHHIKNDAAYGLQYNGTVPWEIIIE